MEGVAVTWTTSDVLLRKDKIDGDFLALPSFPRHPHLIYFSDFPPGPALARPGRFLLRRYIHFAQRAHRQASPSTHPPPHTPSLSLTLSLSQDEGLAVPLPIYFHRTAYRVEIVDVEMDSFTRLYLV